MVQILSQIRASSGAENYQREIRQFLWSHRSEKETDLIIISGEETFKVHRAVILPMSSYLMELLPPSCSCTQPTIFLPPFPSHVLAAALEMIYTGATAIAAFREYRVQVEEVFSLLKIKADIQNVSEEHILYDNVEDIILQESDIISEKYNSGAEEIEENDDEESSFCKEIQSQVKHDENDNSVTLQDKENITPTNLNRHYVWLHEATGLVYSDDDDGEIEEITPTNLCLHEATGLFYSDDNDVETLKEYKNPVKIKRKHLFDHQNETITKKCNNDNMAPRDERNIGKTTLDESYEKDDNVRNVDINEYESLKINQRLDSNRWPKRRFLPKLNYFGKGEQQSSTSSPTPKPKKQTVSKKYDTERDYLEVCRGCNKSFAIILRHLSQRNKHQNCAQAYTTEQLDELKQKAKEMRKLKRVKGKESARLWQANYGKSEKGNESQRRASANYRKSEKGKSNQNRCKQKRRLWQENYRKSEKGKESRKRSMAKYFMSEKGKACLKRMKKRRNEKSRISKQGNKNNPNENNEDVNQGGPEEREGNVSKDYMTRAKKMKAEAVAHAATRLDRNTSSSEDN